MGKLTTTPRPAPSDDSKVIGTSASSVTPIKGRARRQATDDRSVVAELAGTSAPAADAAPPAIIVFGKDEAGKAHASWFGEADAELTVKAAGLMRYWVLPITTDEHRAAASGLAAGRVFASGRCYAPFAKMGVYEALQAFPEAFTPPPPAEPEPEPPLTVVGTPQRWEDLQVGSLVLASTGDDQGWYEAVVAEARGEGLFVMRWRDWPDDAAFVRRADGLALLPARQADAPAAG